MSKFTIKEIEDLANRLEAGGIVSGKDFAHIARELLEARELLSSACIRECRCPFCDGPFDYSKKGIRHDSGCELAEYLEGR